MTRKLTPKQLQDHQYYLARRIAQQQKWIEEHGDSLMGYIARYGSIAQRGDGIHNVLGDGGEAIYAADWAELDRLQAEYRAIREQQTKEVQA